jgi:hypothetical protein
MPTPPLPPTCEPLVVVRRRWNDPLQATVAREFLREPAFKNDPGGVCSPIPRPFLFARVWCDHLVGGGHIHVCDAASAPHELELCVLERDNPPEVFAALRGRRGR